MATFYEFKRERNVARAGAPAHFVKGIEVGLRISPEEARRMVFRGQDVYTQSKSDARKLAGSLSCKPVEDPPHKELFFSHFHSDRIDEAKKQKGARKMGHIFFGNRLQKYQP